MKAFAKTFIIIFVTMLACFAHADSINVNTGGFWETEQCCGGKYFWGDGYNGSSWMDFDLFSSNQKGVRWSSGYLESYGGTNELYGTLSHIFFNAKKDVLTATFTGWDWNWSTNSYQQVNGVFIEHTGPPVWNGSGWSYGYLGNGYIATNSRGGKGTGTVPEPGTLGMFGAGLVGIAGAFKRKLLGT